MKNQAYRPSGLKFQSKRGSLKTGLSDNLGEPTTNLTKSSRKIVQNNSNKKLKRTTLSNQKKNVFTEEDEMSLPAVDLNNLLVEINP